LRILEAVEGVSTRKCHNICDETWTEVEKETCWLLGLRDNPLELSLSNARGELLTTG
jgi:hypothetical protein